VIRLYEIGAKSIAAELHRFKNLQLVRPIVSLFQSLHKHCRPAACKISAKSRNPRLSYSDLKISNLRTEPHLGCHDRWISIFARSHWTHNARTYQIWAKSNNPRRSYNDLKVKNLEAVRHFGFDWKLIFKIQRSSETDDAPSWQFFTQSDNAGVEFLVI